MGYWKGGGSEMAEVQGGFWVMGGTLLFRGGETVRPARWNRLTREWVGDLDFWGDLLDGDTAYDEVTEAEARTRFPAAFR